MRTVDEARAVPGPELPVYQATVLAEPLTRVVADPSGEPPTRSGGCGAVTVPENPRAANAAAFELVTERLAASSVCSVITPPLTIEGVEVPVIWSILESSVWTLSVTLSWLPVAPEATKAICLPFTVMVSPGAKLVASESVLTAPDNSVAPVMGAGVAALLLATVPIAVPSVLKKLSPAATADAATSAVLASVLIELLRAAFRFAAVAVDEAPMVKLPVGGGVVVVAVN